MAALDRSFALYGLRTPGRCLTYYDEARSGEEIMRSADAPLHGAHSFWTTVILRRAI
jgi:hypothetical protein